MDRFKKNSQYDIQASLLLGPLYGNVIFEQSLQRLKAMPIIQKSTFLRDFPLACSQHPMVIRHVIYYCPDDRDLVILVAVLEDADYLYLSKKRCAELESDAVEALLSIVD